MPNPLDVYRAWEIEAPRTVMHAMIIHRGDGSAEQRLTLTDKPFVDRGADGVRYHHLYPAPIQCIVSDIEYEMTLSQASFEDIVITNGEGAFDWMLESPGDVLGKSFSMMRGDQRWSLMSRDLPELFVEIFAGEILEVRPERNGSVIRLAIAPFKYALDSTFASPQSPLLIGGCIGAPMTLVDPVTYRYRFSTDRLQSDIANTPWFRDAGVLLDPATDYALIDEASEFRGLVDLVSEPAGTVTAHIKGAPNDSGDTPASWFVMDYVRPDYLAMYEGKTVHTFGLTAPAAMRVLPSIGKVYVASHGLWIFQYSLVGGKVKDSTWDGVYLDLTSVFGGTITLDNFVDFDLSADGRYLYLLLRGPTQTLLLQRSELSTPGNITTAGAADQSTTSIQGFNPTEDVRGMRIINDGTRLFFSEGNGDYQTRLYEFVLSPAYSIAGGLLGPGGVARSITYPYRMKCRSSGKFCFFDDERAVLVLTDPDLGFGRVKIEKISLVTRATVTDGFYIDGRYLDLQMVNGGSGPYAMDRLCSLDAVGGTVYFGDSDFSTSRRGIKQFQVGADMPRGLFSFQPLAGSASAFSSYYSLHSSCHYSSETVCRDALLEIISPLSENFLVSADGEIYSVIVTPPEWDYAPSGSLAIEQADLIGDSWDFVQHLETITSPSRLVVRYAPNFAVQSETELTTVSLAQKDVLSKQWREVAIDYPSATDVRTEIYEAHWFVSGTPTVGDFTSALPDDITDRLEVVYSQDRFISSIQCALRAIPHFDFIRLGVLLDLNFESSICTVGDSVQLQGRRVNFSRNTQTLRVYK